MVKKSKKKAPSKAKTMDSVEMPPPPPPPPRVSIRPTKSTATRKSSVIMLSSPESSFGEDPSLILNEPSISIIDLARPSTRMSLVEMDMTDLSDPRFSTRSPTTNDDTDLSLTNIIQTPGVAHRDRPKSSWVMRRTRSKSMAPPPPSLLVPENASEDVERPSRSRRTQSGDFVTVTRRARSVRPPARYLESIDENGGSVSKRSKGVQRKPVPETPRVVRNNEVPKTPSVTPGVSRVTKRKRNVTKEKVAEEVPVVPEEPQSSQATFEEESNKSLETTTMSMVSIRRRRPERPPSPKYHPEEQVGEPIPAVQAVERPALPEEPVAGPSPIPAVRPQARSRGRSPKNVTKTRNRAVERPASPKESIVEPKPTPAIRPRAKSASRSRQPRLEGATRTRSRQVARSPSPEYPPEVPTPAPAIRSRARSASRSLKLPSESVTKTRSRPVEHLASPENPVVEPAIRPRARSASRSRKPRLESVTSTRRRQVARSPSPEYPPEEPTSTPANRSRARSASRSIQLPSGSVTKTRSRPVERLASPENSVVEPSIRSRARSASRSKQKPMESAIGTRSPQKVARSPSPAKPTSTARPRARSASRPRQPLSESVTQTRSRQNTPEEPPATYQPAKSSPVNPPVEPPAIRPRTRSASRSRQPLQESISRPKRITKTVSKCPCCVNGESHHEPVRGRPRTRSELPAKTAKSTRSKSVVQETAPKSPPPRSKSVSREAHVPVYRLPVEVPAVVKPTTEKVAAIVEDVYAFDSPGLLGLESDGGKKKKQRKGGSVKKKAKLEGSMRGKRVTPAKKNPLVATIFGTDMHKITRVVKKIGGGPVKRPPTPLETVSLLRPASPAISNYDPVDENDHFVENDVPMENVEPEIAQPVIIPASPPPPPPVNRVNPLIERVLQQRPETPDRTAPPNVTLSFSPLGASSPWRVQDENVLPRTFYFSRSKDLLPSYESDVVVKDANVRPKTPVAEPVLEPAPVSPAKQPSPPAAITGAKAEAMFQSIQKSYEQLKVTSEMSNKLITAMRKYKSTVHDQSLASVSASGELPEDERLIAKFREYEANMKKTYQKLKQWYERSQQQLTHSIKTIEQVSAVPKTLAQRQVLDNFRRDSKVFLSMMNEIESAMNDSNVENVSPPVVDKPTFKDVVILTERNLANRNRSPLKTLEIANVPTRFSPIKSPLVRSSFTAFPTKPKPIATQTAPTTTNTENAPKKDLFGFETDDSEEPLNPTASATTPIKITKQTLKERLESVRKMLPPRPPAASRTYSRPRETATHRMPHVIGSPSRKQPRSVQSVFTSSTPVAAQKRNQTTSSTRRGQLTEPLDADLSAIVDEPEPQAVPSPPPPEALFDDLLASTSLCSAVNRTYSRVPRRNHKRKRNVYLADLGLSDDEDEDEEDEHEHDSEHEAEQQQDEEYNGKTRKQATKKRRVAAGKKKKNVVEETNEFKQFVSEFNSMCEEVDRYKLVIEKPAVVAGGARQRV